jgi:Mg2+ and Co2+ transporter CorA
VLHSVHAEDLPVFRLLRMRARRIPALIEDAKDVLLKLYDADAEYSADALEGIYDNLEAVGNGVLKQEVDDKAAAAALAAILERLAAYHQELESLGVKRADLVETVAQMLHQTVTGKAAP